MQRIAASFSCLIANGVGRLEKREKVILRLSYPVLRILIAYSDTYSSKRRGPMSSCRFVATQEEYVNWIISRLEQQPEPLHLVGHYYYSA